MLKHRLLIVLVAALVMAALAAESRNVSAVVIGVKGTPFIKNENSKDDPPSRQWTKLKLLQTIPSGAQLRVPAGSQLSLSFAIGARRVVLDGEVTVNVSQDSVAIVNGTTDRIRESLARGREAVLAPRERADFSRMGGVSARAGYVNVRTDEARPALSVGLIRADGSTFALPKGQPVDAYYRRSGTQGPWQKTSVVGVEGDRLVAQFDLEPGVPYDIQLLAPPEDSNKKTDYWVYRYRTEELKDLENARATEATPLELVFLYSDYRLYDRAFAALAEAEKGSESDPAALAQLREDLKQAADEYQSGGSR